MKVIQKGQTSSSRLHRILKEVNKMKALSHSKIVNMIETTEQRYVDQSSQAEESYCAMRRGWLHAGG
jgi:hypothetical protein